MAKVNNNKPIRLPAVLICLGRVGKIETDTLVYQFRLKDKMLLYCSTNGKTLYCLQSTNQKSSKDDFEQAVKNKHDQVAEGMALYEQWHDFDPCSGSLCKPPRGFLFDVGRVMAITYNSDKWVGKKRNYIHEFKKPPMLRVNKKNKPTLAIMTGGKISVKKVGITG